MVKNQFRKIHENYLPPVVEWIYGIPITPQSKIRRNVRSFSELSLKPSLEERIQLLGEHIQQQRLRERHPWTYNSLMAEHHARETREARMWRKSSRQNSDHTAVRTSTRRPRAARARRVQSRSQSRCLANPCDGEGGPAGQSDDPPPSPRFRSETLATSSSSQIQASPPRKFLRCSHLSPSRHTVRFPNGLLFFLTSLESGAECRGAEDWIVRSAPRPWQFAGGAGP